MNRLKHPDIFLIDRQTATAGAAGSTLVHTLTNLPPRSFLVVSAAADQVNGITIAGGGLTWGTNQASAANSGDANIFTSFFSAGGAITITTTFNTAAVGRSSVCYVLQGTDPSAAGTATKLTAQNAPLSTYTTTRNNSLVFCILSDFNAIAGATTLRVPAIGSNSVLVLDHDLSGASSYRGVHYYFYAWPVRTYTLGNSTPTGTSSGVVILEIKNFI